MNFNNLLDAITLETGFLLARVADGWLFSGVNDRKARQIYREDLTDELFKVSGFASEAEAEFRRNRNKHVIDAVAIKLFAYFNSADSSKDYGINFKNLTDAITLETGFQLRGEINGSLGYEGDSHWAREVYRIGARYELLETSQLFSESESVTVEHVIESVAIKVWAYLQALEADAAT